MAPWEKYGGAAVAQQPSAPGVIVGRPKAPDPYKDRAELRANQDQNLQEQKFTDDRSNTGFTQRDKLRSDYNALPSIRDYRGSIQSLASALKRGDDGSGDTALIYDYVKALDPTSVVREAEVGMAQGGDARFNSLVAQAKKEFGMDDGGNLSPKARQRLRREIINSNVSRVKQYNQAREQFSELARRSGFDPYEIVGNHDADPYVPLFDEYDRTNKIGRYAGGASLAIPGARANDPGTPGTPRPNPDEIAFGMDLPGSQSDQVTAGRLTGEQQAALDAFLRANAGNKNFGPQQLNAFYQSLGIEGGAAQGDEQFFEAVRSGERFGTQPDYAEQDARRKEDLDAQLRNQGGFTSTGMDYAEGGDAGLYRGVSLGFSDEIAGLGGGLSALLRGESASEGYANERDLERRAQEISRESVGVAPEIAGGLLAPAGVLGRAENVGQFVRQGAALGGAAGFGEGEGGTGSVQNALLGATIGGAAGGALSQAPRAVNALLQTQAGQRATQAIDNAIVRGRPNVDRAVIEAGDRQGVRIRLPDAVESKRPNLAALEKTKTGAPRVAAAKAEDVAATQQALGRLSPEGATARGNSQLGKTLQQAMERTNTKAKDATSALYTRVERLAPGARSDAQETLGFIDGEIARLNGAGRRGNASQVKALQDMRDDIAETGLSVESLQSLRRSIRQRVQDNNLDPRSGDALLSRVDDAATVELENALGAASPKAVSAFRNANKSHAERLAFRREVARELLGTPNNPLDAEKAATRMMSKISEKGDEAGFSRVWSALDDAERKDITATMVENLAGGADDFSFAKLAANLDPDKVNYRTLRTVFGSDGVDALKDLRLIARRKNQTQRGLNNSNTGSIVEDKGNALLDTILTVFGYTQGGIGGAILGSAARGIGEKGANAWRARLLLNPNFTKWLKEAPNTANPAAIDRYFDRLNKVASREQAFLMDARQLQEFMASQFSKSPGRAAADEDTSNRRGVEPR